MSVKTCILLTVVLGCSWCAAAARTQQLQTLQVASDDAAAASRSLLTYYFDASKPTIALSGASSLRPGRTSLTVKLSEPTVSKFMPVMSPRLSGMTHEVANTWSALKNLATMFAGVDSINKASHDSPRLFPRGAVALAAASDSAPVKMTISSIIDRATAQGDISSWAETTPGSVLLLPNGQSTGAVADIMNVAYDESSSVITLTLDVVHDPHTITEFEPHGKQVLDTAKAHYHFFTAPGVKVDAEELLQTLQASNFQLDGLHMFIKGVPLPAQPPVPTLYRALTLPAKAYRQVGEAITITVVAMLYVNQGNNPVAGVNATIAVYGDCNPLIVGSRVKTTNSAGVAEFTLVGREPGVVAVVGGFIPTNSSRVVSDTSPSHIVFYDASHDPYQREEMYHMKHYGQGSEMKSDADSYADNAYKSLDEAWGYGPELEYEGSTREHQNEGYKPKY